MLFLLRDKTVPKSDSNIPASAIWVTKIFNVHELLLKDPVYWTEKKHYVGISYQSPQTRKESKNRSKDYI